MWCIVNLISWLAQQLKRKLFCQEWNAQNFIQIKYFIRRTNGLYFKTYFKKLEEYGSFVFSFYESKRA